MKGRERHRGDNWHFSRLVIMPKATYEEALLWMKLNECGKGARARQLLMRSIAAGALTYSDGQLEGNLDWNPPESNFQRCRPPDPWPYWERAKRLCLRLNFDKMEVRELNQLIDDGRSRLLDDALDRWIMSEDWNSPDDR